MDNNLNILNIFQKGEERVTLIFQESTVSYTMLVSEYKTAVRSRLINLNVEINGSFTE